VGFAADKEQVTLKVADALEPGPASIHLKFTGKLNDKFARILPGPHQSQELFHHAI